ncbi:AB1gp58 [Acinetobacter phage AB1]|uniref:AB1gp58 n=1 Tax=Acinetobacter phage AB1 TaxID=889876 RepID=E2GLZ6_9CAUD|nr:AB1gp58 [Acinetobacter phage AB1]ADO14429.1 AB1gp58 [Acinetobacter phage AB1]
MKSIEDKIKDQEDRKKFLGSILKSTVDDMQKPKRKTTKKQVKESRDCLLNEILSELRNKKRSIPKDWEKGFMSAMSVIEGFKE